MFFPRVAPENLQTNFTLPDNASAGFSLPRLPLNIISSGDHKPVDVKVSVACVVELYTHYRTWVLQKREWKHNVLTSFQMLSLKKNPYSWSESGNISGVVGALSLAREDGSSIRVENLSEEIEVRI